MLADRVPSMLASWDSDLKCRFANRAYKDWFGVEPAALLGTPIQSLLGPTLFDLNEPHLRRALAGEEQVFERAIVGPDKVTRHSLARYTPERVEGAVTGLFVEVTDISVLKAAERATDREIARLAEPRMRARPGNSALEAAAELERLQSVTNEMAVALADEKERRNAFLARLAHELRNSLAPIQMGVSVLCDPLDRSPAIKSRLHETLSRQMRHASRLVEDVLDYGCLASGVLSMSERHVDLLAVLRDARDMCLPHLECTGHTLVVDAVIAPPPVLADPHRLVQVFFNLLHNAIKYTPCGGRIAVTVEHDADAIEVSVQDNGIGFASDASNSIFDIYAQLPASHTLRQGGVGIGLALVRQIVEAHGGTVSAESGGLDAGSTFTVRLPHAARRTAT